MLSYQHIYHAGCLPDLHKHAALASLFELMAQKDKPLTYVETHAGRGYYDLNAPEAQKTGEAAEGIRRMLKENWFPADHPLMRIIHETRKNKGADIYPGSAAIAQHYRRPDDKMHLFELHPSEVILLRGQIKDEGIKILKKDGFEALLSLAPPNPRRGLVFIDPSYEIKKEYELVPEFIEKLAIKWPVAVICLWYPKLPARPHEAMVKRLKALNLPKTESHEVEFALPPEKNETGSWKALYGSGLFIVNTPFGLSEKITDINARLHRIKERHP